MKYRDETAPVLGPILGIGDINDPNDYIGHVEKLLLTERQKENIFLALSGKRVNNSDNILVQAIKNNSDDNTIMSAIDAVLDGDFVGNTGHQRNIFTATLLPSVKAIAQLCHLSANTNTNTNTPSPLEQAVANIPQSAKQNLQKIWAMAQAAGKTPWEYLQEDARHVMAVAATAHGQAHAALQPQQQQLLQQQQQLLQQQQLIQQQQQLLQQQQQQNQQQQNQQQQNGGGQQALHPYLTNNNNAKAKAINDEIKDYLEWWRQEVVKKRNAPATKGKQDSLITIKPDAIQKLVNEEGLMPDQAEELLRKEVFMGLCSRLEGYNPKTQGDFTLGVYFDEYLDQDNKRLIENAINKGPGNIKAYLEGTSLDDSGTPFGAVAAAKAMNDNNASFDAAQKFATESLNRQAIEYGKAELTRKEKLVSDREAALKAEDVANKKDVERLTKEKENLEKELREVKGADWKWTKRGALGTFLGGTALLFTAAVLLGVLTGGVGTGIIFAIGMPLLVTATVGVGIAGAYKDGKLPPGQEKKLQKEIAAKGDEIGKLKEQLKVRNEQENKLGETKDKPKIVAEMQNRQGYLRPDQGGGVSNRSNTPGLGY